MYIQNEKLQALFDAWYEMEMPRIFRYIAYRVHDRATAEELTAAVCEAALGDLHRFDPCRGEFNAWMFGLARKIVLRHFRRISRDPHSIPLETLPDLRGPGCSPEETVELIEEFQEVVDCLHWLSEHEQEVIALFYGAELPARTIGEVMGISEGNVRVLVHRALKRLRALMRSKEKA